MFRPRLQRRNIRQGMTEGSGEAWVDKTHLTADPQLVDQHRHRQSAKQGPKIHIMTDGTCGVWRGQLRQARRRLFHDLILSLIPSSLYILSQNLEMTNVCLDIAPNLRPSAVDAARPDVAAETDEKSAVHADAMWPDAIWPDAIWPDARYHDLSAATVAITANAGQNRFSIQLRKASKVSNRDKLDPDHPDLPRRGLPKDCGKWTSVANRFHKGLGQTYSCACSRCWPNIPTVDRP
jgi:hypothetical protein